MAFKLENKQQRTVDKGQSDLQALLKKEIVLFGGGFTTKKKQAFYQELAVLLKAGITLKEGLTLIIESLKKPADKEMIGKILTDVVNGKPFSEAIYTSKNFSEYEFYSLKIGEETGTIAQVCQELGVFYERKNEQKRIVIGALTYPSIVFFTALLVVFFMLSYVVPMFQDIFKQNNVELPFLTKMIIRLSDLVKSYGFLFVLIVLSVLFAGRLLRKNENYTKAIHYLALRIPVFGPFISKIYLAQFTQAVALLTASKVPILNSIQMVKKMIGFVPLKEALENVEKNILQGHSLSISMKENRMFDSRIISLVKVAEETSQTEYVFKQLNEQYNQEVILQSKVMSTVLEPLIIVFVGVLVAVLLVAMYLPMFQLSSVIG